MTTVLTINSITRLVFKENRVKVFAPTTDTTPNTKQVETGLKL